MADIIKINSLTKIATIADDDALPIVDTSELETKKITGSQLKTYTQGDLDTRLTTAESDINNVDTRLTTGWIPVSDTWTYASATTITIPAGGLSKYNKGDKLKLIQSGSIKYFYIIDVADTLLTITAGSSYTLTNVAITGAYISHSSTPVGFPPSFTYICAVSAPAGTTPPTYSANECSFSINGGIVNVVTRLTNITGGTAGNGVGELRFSLPVPSKDLLIYGLGVMYEQDIATVKTIFARHAGATLIYTHDVGGVNVNGNDQSSVNRYIGVNLTYPLL